MALILGSTSPVGVLIDAYEQGSSLAQRAEPERARIFSEQRAAQAVFDEAHKAAIAAATSRELTKLGRDKAIVRAIKAGREAMKPYDANAATRAARAAELRAKAIEPPTAERNVETLMLEREIRDRLAGKDPLEVNVLYLSAIERQDWTTVSAIERAPAAFPLITREQRETGDAMKLTRSPLAGQVAEAEAEAYVYQSVAASVHAELDKLAEDFRVETED